jgi:NAD(P)-dependent dehydrogenase (short-subunit alcohol dehydrogenase family)
MKLKDKTAIVTGARRGIGKAIALKLAKEGAKVAVTDISKEDCQKVVEEIENLGGQGLALELDVTKEDEIEKVIQETKKKFGRIDVLVNNAGIFIQKNLEDMETSEINKLLDINLRGAIQCIKHVLPEMKNQKYGKIVNIASIAGIVGFNLSSTYCASKGALVNLTRELALDLGPYNINVNAVAPGVIETEMTEGMLSDEKTKEGLLSNIPYGRVGRPEDIASAVSFLADDESEYVTGQILAVDGGWLTK